MIDRLPTLSKFIRQLQHIPYLASKNIYRVADHFLELDNDKIQLFCNILNDLKLKMVKCNICWVWKEIDKSCVFCSSSNRDKSIICVVENWQDLIAIEKTESYKGVYHVLGGAISPLEGIGPDDLKIDNLVERAVDVQELIFGMNQTPEGEATAAYIASKLKKYSIKITCLARGIPVGSLLGSMDRVTVHKAIVERRPF